MANGKIKVGESKYLVRATNSEGSVLFYDIDQNSGGYPYFSAYARFSQALTYDEAMDIIAEMEKPNDSNGFPNTLLHQASGVNLRNPQTITTVEIVEIVYQPVKTVEIVTKITKDEVDAQRAVTRQQALAKLSPAERLALGL